MGETMTAAVFEGEGRLVLQERPIPVIKEPTDVLIEVGAVGICGTDLHILDVPPRHPAAVGAVLGHEFAGRIAGVGSAVDNVKVGDHIVADPNSPCGKCVPCSRGYPNACLGVLSAPVPGYANTFGIFRDGAMAKYMVMPGCDVYRIAPAVPATHACVAEPLAVAVNGLNKVGVQPGETVVVLGAGPIGLCFLGVASAAGARTIVSEPSAMRREAAIACGADIVLDPTVENLEERVMSETDGEGADVAVEAVGHLFDVCVRIARFGGRVLLFGDDAIARPAIPQAWVMRRELQIFGAFLPKFTWCRAIQMLEQGLIPMDHIVTHQLPLSQVHQGMQLLRDGKAIKVAICPGL